MTYQQVQRLKYYELLYNQYILTTTLYKRRPFRVVYYQSEGDTQTIVIFSRTQGGNSVSRHLKIDKSDAEKVIEKIEKDFNLTAESLDEAEQE